MPRGQPVAKPRPTEGRPVVVRASEASVARQPGLLLTLKERGADAAIRCHSPFSWSGSVDFAFGIPILNAPPSFWHLKS